MWAQAVVFGVLSVSGQLPDVEAQLSWDLPQSASSVRNGPSGFKFRPEAVTGQENQKKEDRNEHPNQLPFRSIEACIRASFKSRIHTVLVLLTPPSCFALFAKSSPFLAREFASGIEHSKNIRDGPVAFLGENIVVRGGELIEVECRPFATSFERRRKGTSVRMRKTCTISSIASVGNNGDDTRKSASRGLSPPLPNMAVRDLLALAGVRRQL